MLFAAFGTLMFPPSLEAITRIAGEGKYNTKVTCLGSHRVNGWRFDYVANKESWVSESKPDIHRDRTESIWVVVYEIPTRTLGYICEGSGIYSSQCKFDYLNIDAFGREAMTVRQAESQPHSKPSVSQVVSIARAALDARVDETYIYDVIIGRAGFDHSDAERIYDEDMYSRSIGKAGELIRDWYSQNVHYDNRSD